MENRNNLSFITYTCKCDLNYIMFNLILIRRMSQMRGYKIKFEKIENKQVLSSSHG